MTRRALDIVTVDLVSAVKIPKALHVGAGLGVPDTVVVAVGAEVVIIARCGDESDLVSAIAAFPPVGNPLDPQFALGGDSRDSQEDSNEVHRAELHLGGS